jgi:hypothetical protein
MFELRVSKLQFCVQGIRSRRSIGLKMHVMLELTTYVRVHLQISWQWLPFTTSARSDNLQLYHWVLEFFYNILRDVVNVASLYINQICHNMVAKRLGK